MIPNKSVVQLKLLRLQMNVSAILRLYNENLFKVNYQYHT